MNFKTVVEKIWGKAHKAHAKEDVWYAMHRYIHIVPVRCIPNTSFLLGFA